MDRLYPLLVGLVGAAIVHIVVLFLVPEVSSRGPWAVLAEAGPLHRFVPFGDDATAPLDQDADPLFRAVACRYDLGDGPVRLSAEGRVPFWSASIYDRFGQNAYGLNDRIAERGALDTVLLTPDQMIALQKEPRADLDQAILVESVPESGIAILRAFLPDPTWEPVVTAFLDAASCAPLD